MSSSHGMNGDTGGSRMEEVEVPSDPHHTSHDPFKIAPKGPAERLKGWRKVALTVNAARRFRYTLDFKKAEENEKIKKEPASRLRAGTNVIRAVERFNQAGRGVDHDAPPAGFGVGPKTLVHMLQDRRPEDLEKLGGINGLAGKINTNFEEGIKDDPEEISKRKDAFGSNTYPKKKPKGILHFVWEACQDTALIVLMVAAVVSLAAEMYSEGPKESSYDGAAILVAVLLVIVTTAYSDYKQSLQFRNLNAEKENIKLSVIRGGERKQVSIWDLVVGDIIPLSIGGQVPADGVLVEGHALSIDESTMTGATEPVKKDNKGPFLLSGCKVQDGQGIMMVTGVGINTEWGQVMASVTEDNGEETPLQVRLNGDATIIGKVGLSLAVLVFIIQVIRFFAIDFKEPANKKASRIIVRIVEMFSISVTIVEVAVPEGLPLAVTLTSSPTDKLKLVKALKARGNVVAVTGDGTNDAPALHEADIGLSMGIAGTEVAKESSDIVILVDNFTSIVKVVRWGRSVYSNIQKFIQFQLTFNISALVINFVAACLTGDSPLTTVQLLWANLIVGTLGPVALATVAPTDDLMDRAPVDRGAPLITNFMWTNIIVQTVFQVVVFLLALYFGENKITGIEYDPGLKATIIFNTFVFCQIFNEVNARRPDTLNIFQGIHKDLRFIIIIVIEAVLQFIIVQFCGKFAQTRQLSARLWGLCIAVGSLSWIIAGFLKLIAGPMWRSNRTVNAVNGGAGGFAPAVGSEAPAFDSGDIESALRERSSLQKSKGAGALVVFPSIRS